MTMWRPLLRLMHQQGAKTRPPRMIYSKCMSGLAGAPGGTTAAAPKIVVREARDTLDLIDQLLWVLGSPGSREGGFVFFDLDETLVTRDTFLIDGLGSTRALMSRLEAKLGPSSETLRTIHREMERDYYSADPRLVDPLLSRVIRALKIQGHSVFGLTSNALDGVHAPQMLETLSKYKIRFSVPEVRGELPRSGALVMDHPVCRGVIFIDNEQTVSHDKGEVIAEFVGLLLHNGSKSSPDVNGANLKPSEPAIGGAIHIRADPALRKCVLVDNTSEKCEKAAISFARDSAAQGLLELHTLHFTEAENLVDSPDALMQLRRILSRLKARGLIGVDLIAEDVLVAPVGTVRRRDRGAASTALQQKGREAVAERRDAKGPGEHGSPTVGRGMTG